MFQTAHRARYVRAHTWFSPASRFSRHCTHAPTMPSRKPLRSIPKKCSKSFSNAPRPRPNPRRKCFVHSIAVGADRLDHIGRYRSSKPSTAAMAMIHTGLIVVRASSVPTMMRAACHGASVASGASRSPGYHHEPTGRDHDAAAGAL